MCFGEFNLLVDFQPDESIQWADLSWSKLWCASSRGGILYKNLGICDLYVAEIPTVSALRGNFMQKFAKKIWSILHFFTPVRSHQFLQKRDLIIQFNNAILSWSKFQQGQSYWGHFIFKNWDFPPISHFITKAI